MGKYQREINLLLDFSGYVYNETFPFFFPPFYDFAFNGNNLSPFYRIR